MTLTKSKQVTAQEIEYMLNEGLTKAEVARRLDISASTVGLIVGREKPKQCWGAEELNRVKRLLEEGKSVREIAADYGVHYTTLYAVLRRHGISTNKKLGRPRKIKDAAVYKKESEETPIRITRDPCPFQPTGYLQILSQNCVEARGAATDYSIDICNGLVYLHGGINGVIKKDQLFSMERELMDIYRLLEGGTNDERNVLAEGDR